eukprot:NODE_530_length_1318_cov_27.895193_g382_i0.p1 GENE.NODE_530_length_1318_cov_27.895193_g382_i0~~NODE_530_length_1318_cov_27.895193_g382_i0.p1  ORF type:complete len:330 (+),score=11.76 NODE_530_length_1318_cov_27.895193_g382_i0:279-1268(+)
MRGGWWRWWNCCAGELVVVRVERQVFVPDRRHGSPTGRGRGIVLQHGTLTTRAGKATIPRTRPRQPHRGGAFIATHARTRTHAHAQIDRHRYPPARARAHTHRHMQTRTQPSLVCILHARTQRQARAQRAYIALACVQDANKARLCACLHVPVCVRPRACRGVTVSIYLCVCVRACACVRGNESAATVGLPWPGAWYGGLPGPCREGAMLQNNTSPPPRRRPVPAVRNKHLPFHPHHHQLPGTAVPPPPPPSSHHHLPPPLPLLLLHSQPPSSVNRSVADGGRVRRQILLPFGVRNISSYFIYFEESVEAAQKFGDLLTNPTPPPQFQA